MSTLLIIFLVGLAIYLVWPDQTRKSRSDSIQGSHQQNFLRRWDWGTKKTLDIRSKLAKSGGPNVKQIATAIAHNRDVSFDYEKSSGEWSHRKLTPKELLEYTQGQTGSVSICVEGFCHLRGEMRTFNVARMSNLVVL